ASPPGRATGWPRSAPTLKRASGPPSGTRPCARRWSRSAPTCRRPARTRPTRPTPRRSAPPIWTSRPSTGPTPPPRSDGAPRASVVELAAYLDHWSGVRREARLPAAWRKPLDVARAADADDYRNRLRGLVAAEDLKAQAAKLKALADEPQAARLPAATAV